MIWSMFVFPSFSITTSFSSFAHQTVMLHWTAGVHVPHARIFPSDRPQHRSPVVHSDVPPTLARHKVFNQVPKCHGSISISGRFRDARNESKLHTCRLLLRHETEVTTTCLIDNGVTPPYGRFRHHLLVNSVTLCSQSSRSLTWTASDT